MGYILRKKPPKYLMDMCTVPLTLRISSWVKDMPNPLGYEQQSEISSRSNLAVRSYGPDTDFGNKCSVTLTLGI